MSQYVLSVPEVAPNPKRKRRRKRKARRRNAKRRSSSRKRRSRRPSRKRRSGRKTYAKRNPARRRRRRRNPVNGKFGVQQMVTLGLALTGLEYGSRQILGPRLRRGIVGGAAKFAVGYSIGMICKQFKLLGPATCKAIQYAAAAHGLAELAIVAAGKIPNVFSKPLVGGTLSGYDDRYNYAHPRAMGEVKYPGTMGEMTYQAGAPVLSGVNVGSGVMPTHLSGSHPLMPSHLRRGRL